MESLIILIIIIVVVNLINALSGEKKRQERTPTVPRDRGVMVPPREKKDTSTGFNAEDEYAYQGTLGTSYSQDTYGPGGDWQQMPRFRKEQQRKAGKTVRELKGRLFGEDEEAEKDEGGYGYEGQLSGAAEREPSEVELLGDVSGSKGEKKAFNTKPYAQGRENALLALNYSRNELIKGVIWSEVLGPPRSRHPRSRRRI